MSLQIVAKITCDGCGATVLGKVGRSSTRAKDSYYDCLCHAARMGWVTIYRYGPAKHYCLDCSDAKRPKSLKTEVAL